MIDIVVLGAGGYGQQVAWAIRRQGDRQVIGMLDEASEPGQTFDGIPILRDIQKLEDDLGHRNFYLVCGIGRQDVRRRWVEEFSGRYKFTTVIDPTALVCHNAVIGQNVVVLANTVLSVSCTIEDNVNINWLCLITHHVRVGEFTNIASGVKVTGGVDIGRGCDIGTNASVLPNLKVGDNTVIGAGAVVTSDLPANVTAVGVPARVIKNKK